MARPEPSNITQCVSPTSITSRASSLSKDQYRHNDEMKNEFSSREGSYKICALIDNLGKLGSANCLSEAVKMTVLHRSQFMSNPNSSNSSRRSSSTGHSPEQINESSRSSVPTSNGIETNGTVLLTDLLAFNVGRELIIHEFTEATQVRRR